MGLLSIFKRSSRSEEAPSAPPAVDAVAQARTRARRRLIGATVLLGVGIVGFPLVFETQPRPVAVDLPFELPRKEGAALPEVHPPRPLSPAPGAVVADPVTPEASAPAEIVERASDQGREVVASAASSSGAAPSPLAKPLPPAAAPASAGAPAKSASRPSAAKPVAAASAVKHEGAPKPDKRDPGVHAQRAEEESARAQAALEGRVAPPAAVDAAAARIVIQVGAYTEPDKLREARHKVEALGLKTYTQVVEREGAKRTRVRVGPFSTRAEADKVAARLKAAGLPAAILSL